MMVSRIYMVGNGNGTYVRFAPNFGFQLGKWHWCHKSTCKLKGWG